MFELIIDWFLRILGILVFIGIIFRVKLSNYYIENVKILSIKPSSTDMVKNFKTVTRSKILTDGKSKFIIFPKNVDILHLKFFTIMEDGKKDKLIEEVRQIRESYAFTFEITLIGTVSHHKAEWETSLGEKGEFTFDLNGYNGNIDMTSYKYKLSFKGLIFKILGIN